MRIAIIGAGFCGLATAWHLLHHPLAPSPLHITLFDSKGIGGGASGIAAGLLHPFAGAHAKLNWMGKEGMSATAQLLNVASQTLGQPVHTDPGLLRLALTSMQEIDYRKCAAQYPDEVEWKDTSMCQKLYTALAPAPGLWIKKGLVVHSSLYLQGLWLACQQKGVCFIQEHIQDIQTCHAFDLCVLAAGAQVKDLVKESFPFSLVKGQVLELAWPSKHSPLPFAVNSHAYALMNDTHATCLVGATYERGYIHSGPDIHTAKQDILPKAVAMLPLLAHAPILACQAGMRVVTPDHLPWIRQLQPKIWMITGMGSKGLLYHALIAYNLVDKMYKIETNV